MATTKKITMREFNGTDYDTLYPKTVAAQIDDVYSKNETYPKSQLYTQSQLYTRQQILSDATKTLYGLGSSAIPNDVFSWIAQETSRIATGSYVGTGTYGPNNKNSLTFSFSPKFVAIWKSNASVSPLFVFTADKSNYTLIRPSGGDAQRNCSFDGKTLSWWSGDGSYGTGDVSTQANESGITYNYVAFGQGGNT